MFLFFYNFFLYLTSPIIILIILIRVILGKEHNKKYIEKLGITNNIYKKKNKLIWFHACSVGEVKSSYNLIKNTLKNNELVLVTTSTYLSGLDVKKSFAEKVIHQYLPLDLTFFVKRFLI